MHQTTREFLLSIEKEKPGSRFALGVEEANGIIAAAAVSYLTLCFGNPEPMPGSSTDITTWSWDDYQKYVQYLDERSWINYALHNLKTHHDLSNQKESVSQLVDALIKQLVNSQGFAFLGNWMAYNFGRTKSAPNIIQSITSLIPLLFFHDQVSEDFKYKVLNAAGELKLFQVFESLLEPCMHDTVQTQTETSLITCVRKGLFGASRMLADREEDFDTKDNAGWTALHHAAAGGHEAVTRLLLERGADTMATNNHGQRALHHAAAGGHEAITRLLLERGADTMAKNNHGQRAVQIAVKNL